MTDKNYITNSYHVHVTENIDAFEKLKFEAQFQKLSPGGAISYVEVPNMQQNLDAVLSVMQYIYDNIMYAELNTKSDFCQVCGYTEMCIRDRSFAGLSAGCDTAEIEHRKKRIDGYYRDSSDVGKLCTCLLYTSKLLEMVEGTENVERMDALLSLAVTGGDYEWI